MLRSSHPAAVTDPPTPGGRGTSRTADAVGPAGVCVPGATGPAPPVIPGTQAPTPRTGRRAPDDEDVGWGAPVDDSNDELLTRDRPPHW